MKDELLAGRYQLEHELGRGGMATVFLARDLRLARRVAVKVMHPGGDGRLAERFRREAELVASLKHPNVLEVHDFGEDATHGPFLVCEWVQGESLRELARRLAPVPPEMVAVLGWELARALEAAHARGVVHRDVKPENVLVSKGGPLKLADFGIAALEDQERLTSTGAITGSLAYMAPERLDTGAWSPASDVYAVGVILFELCTGTTPHAGKGGAHLAASVMTRDAPRLAEAAPGTSEPLSALVDRCLARDSRDRPADGAELAACLETVVRRIAGPPAEASRSFFAEPEARAARWREGWFQRLLSDGRALLSRGEGAQAARLLNTALTLRPGAAEVLALLRARPRAGRAKVVLGAGAVLVVLVGLFVVWGRVGTSVEPDRDPPLRPQTSAPTAPAPQLTPGANSVTGRSGTHASPRTPGAASTSATPGASVSPSTHGAASASATPSASAPPSAHGAASASATPGASPPPSAHGAASATAPSGAHSSPLTHDAASAAPVPVEPAVPVRPPSASAPRGSSESAPLASRSPPQRASRSRQTDLVTGESSQPGALSSASANTRTEPVTKEPSSSGIPSPASTATAPTREPLVESSEPATLTVVTRPWAEVFVDGQSRGYTPRVREVRLSPGTHRLRFDNPLCEPVEEVIHVSAGETVSREIALQVRLAEVSISAPPGARIFIDGREVGMAPLRGPVKLEHGGHVLSARGPRGEVFRRELDVVAGEQTRVVLGREP